MLKRLRQKLRNNLAALEMPANPTAAKVRTLIPKCFVCERDTAGHRFATIASTVLSKVNETRVRAIYQHVEEHDWTALRDFTDFDGELDAVLVYAVRCSNHPGGMVLLISDPHELYAGPEAIRMELITDAELDIIASFVKDTDWQEM
ncbi:MAG: hypothetical protein JWQ87_5282 [Candidatus Sulfotelmatobacter sp.]|nr:hypothetical protein [Candidatus Sulfotelmatobacter sp.]